MKPIVHNLRHKLAPWAFTLVLAATASASLSVNVISPTVNYQGTAAGGTPVFYEAYATNSACAAGIGAMRIYTAPGVNAFTVNGDHLETFIALPLGSYNTVVQAWDNCGNVAKAAVPLSVTTGNITVYLPTSSVGYSPVHIAASAQTGCNGGINAIRLYTAPYVDPYTINSNQLDTYVTVPPGNYNMTLVAWDACGGVFTSQLALATSGSADGYLYGTYGQNGAGGTVAQLQVDGEGNVINPNGDADPPQFPAPDANSVVVDPGGWFLYAGAKNSIYAFQIDPEKGSLSAMPGSFSASGLSQVLMDPSGNFVYGISTTTSSITTYRVNRSNGALTIRGSTGTLSGDYLTFAVDGPFLYYLAINVGSATQLGGYALNVNNGTLTAISGLPISLPVKDQFNSILAANDRVFAASGFGGSSAIFGYSLDPTSGALTRLPGSPLRIQDNTLSSLWADWEGRYLWAWYTADTSNNTEMNTLDIGPKGRLAATDYYLYNAPVAYFTEDLTGNYAFALWQQNFGTQEYGVQTYYISTGGALYPASLTVLPNAFNVEAVARQDPD